MTPEAEFFTTLHLPLRAEWMRRAETLDPTGISHPALVGKVLRAAGQYDAIVLNGSLPREQVAAALIGLTRPSRRLILADCTWKLGTGRADRAATRSGIRAIDRAAATYCVLSSGELGTFPKTWGVDPARVTFTPWCYTLSDAELRAPVSDAGFVFAGGDSLRNYEPLIEAAEGLDAPVRIAARRALDGARGRLPANVRGGACTHDEFVGLTASARIVVVSLEDRRDRSAGQGTYLNAMALGKPVIVTDVMGARDYIEHRVTGLLVPPGDAVALRDALRWSLADENDEALRALGARGRQAALKRFGPDRYVAALLAAVNASRATTRP